MSTAYECLLYEGRYLCSCQDMPEGLYMQCTIQSLEDLNLLSHPHYELRVKYMSLRFPNASTLPPLALNYFQEMSFLRIRGNRLASVDGNAFTGLEQNLKALEFLDCNFREILLTSLHRLINLDFLRMSNNKITAIEESLRELLVRDLILSRNMISKIVREAFPLILNRLNLDNNNLHSLNRSLAGNPFPLQQLHISGNRISDLSGELNELSILRYLYAGRNKIETIDNGCLLNASFLEVLDLSHNNIYEIVDGLKGLGKLSSLDLSYNKLVLLDEMALSDLTSLNMLNVSFNYIIYVGVREFDCLSSLRVMDISHNELQNLYFLDPKRELNPGSLRRNASYQHGTKCCKISDFSTLQFVNMSGVDVPCNEDITPIICSLRSKGVSLNAKPCASCG